MMFSIDDEAAITDRSVIFIDLSASVYHQNLTPIVDFLVTTATVALGNPKDFELHIVSFNDCQTYNALRYSKKNAADIQYYPIQGGGGSNIGKCWEYMKRNNLNQAVILTDGVLDYGVAPPFPFISFLIHSGIKINYPSYGTCKRI